MKQTEEQKLEHIIRRMQTDQAIDAPADALRYAKNLFRTRAAEPRLSVMQRILAVMSLDLTPDQAAFGERSATATLARQVLFESGDHAVDLRVQAAGKGFEIRGQVLGDGFDNGHVLIANAKYELTAKMDEMSGFTLADVPAGEYSITITGQSAEIFIEQLILE